MAAAEGTGEAFDLLLAHFQVGIPLLYQGNFSRALQHGQSLKTFHRDMRGPSPFIRWPVRGRELPLRWADALERIRQFDEQRRVAPAT